MWFFFFFFKQKTAYEMRISDWSSDVCSSDLSSSMLSLAIVTFPPSSSAISSSAGPIMRHGPHHSAQKSTSTGVLLEMTSLWNEASVTFLVAMGRNLQCVVQI